MENSTGCEAVIQKTRDHSGDTEANLFFSFQHPSMTRTITLPPSGPPRPDGLKVGGWWHTQDGGRIVCDLCPRACTLKEGDRGFCFVRQVVGGEMVLTTYGKSTGFCVDPIEKKPLNHFYPGTSVLSFGTAGCNLGCKFCQNWSISKSREIEQLSEHAGPEDAMVEDPIDAFTYVGGLAAAPAASHPGSGVDSTPPNARQTSPETPGRLSRPPSDELTPPAEIEASEPTPTSGVHLASIMPAPGVWPDDDTTLGRPGPNATRRGSLEDVPNAQPL